jgi:hypothetical protein
MTSAANLAPQLVDARDWCQVRDGGEAKLCAGPNGNETFVLVRSAKRRTKEQAMPARFSERIALCCRCRSGVGAAAFHIHKSQLSIRPIWQQRETRVPRGHAAWAAQQRRHTAADARSSRRGAWGSEPRSGHLGQGVPRPARSICKDLRGPR